MKKLLLILLCVPLFGLGQETTADKQYIDNMIDEVIYKLPITDPATGVIWYDLINQNNKNILFCYYAPKDFIVQSKEEFVEYCKTNQTLMSFLNKDINIVWLYYNILDREKLLGQIIINIKDI